MRDEYAYHRPTDEQQQTMEALRQAFSDLHDDIERLGPSCRYRSLALTELETAAFWTNKAVVLGAKGNRRE